VGHSPDHPEANAPVPGRSDGVGRIRRAFGPDGTASRRRSPDARDRLPGFSATDRNVPAHGRRHALGRQGGETARHSEFDPIRSDPIRGPRSWGRGTTPYRPGGPTGAGGRNYTSVVGTSGDPVGRARAESYRDVT
jgi:hypothetical protein